MPIGLIDAHWVDLRQNYEQAVQTTTALCLAAHSAASRSGYLGHIAHTSDKRCDSTTTALQNRSAT